MSNDPNSSQEFFMVNAIGGTLETYKNGELVESYSQTSTVIRSERRKRVGNPDVFAGPKLKVERAKAHIAELEAAIQAFHSRNPYELISHIDPQTGENVFRVLVKEGIPVGFSAIIGDAVHNARAALDYLVCDLVRRHSQHDGQDRGFPIIKRPKTLKSGAVGKINGVGPRAERLIFRLAKSDAWHELMWALHWLDIFDKHNCIVTVAAATVQITSQVGIPGVFVGPNGNIYFGGPGPDGRPFMQNAGISSRFRRVHPLEDNVEVYRAPGGFYEDVQVAVAVAFGKNGVVEGEPAPETLRQMVDLVERTIEIAERYAT